MTIKFNWPLVASFVAALAGVVGTVLTPTLGDTLSTNVQAVLMAISGLLLVVPVHQASSTAAARSQAKYAATLHVAPTAPIKVPSL